MNQLASNWFGVPQKVEKHQEIEILVDSIKIIAFFLNELILSIFNMQDFQNWFSIISNFFCVASYSSHGELNKNRL